MSDNVFWYFFVLSILAVLVLLAQCAPDDKRFERGIFETGYDCALSGETLNECEARFPSVFK